ncbi:MAG TPA: selenide, water dikinase SelD, partial [candidate division Zixibacteria bacterium]|nr:selenide, water dikinase SelD [candidate division Zixibacteria bacterium]
DPNQVITNSSAKPGDCLYLTKRLGTGLITTGIKRDVVSEELTKQVIDQMAQLNREPAELMIKQGASSATDITGYGLMGHAYEMAAGSVVTIRLNSSDVPLLPQARELAAAGMIPGGAVSNREFLNMKYIVEAKNLDKNLEHVLFDPQTSGGLFIAMPKDRCGAFEAEANQLNIEIWKVGEVVPAGEFPIIIA